MSASIVDKICERARMEVGGSFGGREGGVGFCGFVADDEDSVVVVAVLAKGKDGESGFS